MSKIISTSSLKPLVPYLPAHCQFLITTPFVSDLSVGCDQSRIPVVVDGPKGIGKSSALSLVAHEELKKGTLVIYERAISFVNGSVPYHRVNDHFDTPKTSHSILSRFMALNGKNLKSSSFYKSLKDGIQDLNNSTRSLKKIINELQNIDKKVLIVIDQANALYSNSAYFDEESRRIPAHNLLAVRIFHEMIKKQVICSQIFKVSRII